MASPQDVVFDENRRFDDLFTDSLKNLETLLRPFQSEFVSNYRWWERNGRLFNGQFDCFDADSYYSIIRKYQSKKIIEIGCGHSTRFALDAVKKNGVGSITCIDPEPRINLPRKVNHICKKVEEVECSIFSNLDKNDVLFIDSSHTQEETSYHLNKIFPLLKVGVLIHIHDIVYPYKALFAGEEIPILELCQKNKNKFKVITGNSYLWYYHKQAVKILAPFSSYNEKKPLRLCGSVWVLRI